MLTGKGWDGVPADMRKQADTPWFQSLLAFNPVRVLRDVRQPLLFVHGEPVRKLTGDNILQVLLVAILFGVALAGIGDKGANILRLLDEAATAVFRLVAIVMRAAPIGAFGAMAFTVGQYGLSSLSSLV